MTHLNIRSCAKWLTISTMSVLIMVSAAMATNGYFSHGYGTQYKGMAGAGVALSIGTLSAATNPASMVGAGAGYDIGIAYFSPIREFTVTGNPSNFPGTFGLAPGTVESNSNTFIIPSLGANWMLNETASIGVSIYGNGGMNSDYDAPVFGFTPTGINFEQLFIVPTYAIQINSQHALGASIILGYQTFEAKGLGAFAGFSSDAANLTDNGKSTTTGLGYKVGYIGEFSEMVSVGASYQTKTFMGNFDEYAGLFAEQGDFDVPATWTAGVALSPNDDLTIVADVQQILYTDIASVSNSFLPNLQTALLGNDAGAGFGWEDMTIIKIGAQYQLNEGMAVRVGFSTGGQPIPASEMLFNILAPAVVEQHISFGFSKYMEGGREFSLALTKVLSNTVSGPNPLEAPDQQTIELKMNQLEIEAGFSF